MPMAPAWTLKLLLLPLLLLSALSCLLCPLQPTRYPPQSMLGLPSGAAPLCGLGSTAGSEAAAGWLRGRLLCLVLRACLSARLGDFSRCS